MPVALPVTPYTSHYCEENIYLLAQAFLTSPDVERYRFFVVFISNRNKQAIIFQQKASRYDELHYPVVWDYHVILVKVPLLMAPRAGPESALSENLDSWVYDLDSRLEKMPCAWEGPR
jgi:protein N-terminal glutamine amidohydrolase